MVSGYITAVESTKPRPPGATDLVSVEQLARELGPRIYHVALRVLGDETDAEDAVQQAFTDAVRGVSGFRGEASASTWMWRIAHHAMGKTLRRRARKEVQLLSLSELGPSGGEVCDAVPVTPEEAVDQARIVDLAIRCLDQLPAAERELLALRDLEGLSVREVSEILGMSIAATKSRIHRARLALRRAVRLLAKTEQEAL